MRVARLTPREFRGKNPIKIVNLCFLVVFICSVLLTWRELVVLEQAYVSAQRNSLEGVATTFERHLQYSVDKLVFYRNAMQSALANPITTDISRQMLREFAAGRARPYWQIRLDGHRSMPLNGVSDTFVEESPQLNRDNEWLDGELSASLEFGYLMHISTGSGDLQQRTWYTSRAGFFVTSDEVPVSQQIVSQFYRQVTHPWFTGHTQRDNRARGLRWTHLYDPTQKIQLITASIPLDYRNHWYGVLGMDFSLDALGGYLRSIIDDEEKGDIYLFDSRFQFIAASTSAAASQTLFTPAQLGQLANNMEQANEGGLRMDTRYVSWAKLNNFDGVLLKIHTVDRGVQEQFGSITIALLLFWSLSTAMLLLSWFVIRRMVNNMSRLQEKLTWQAWFDPLTRLYNRGAFFERAQALAGTARQQEEPYSVIQLDLDHFKSVNDRFGHQAGDRVLCHAASMLASSLREQDIAGRVGGEEFCILLPGTTLAQAHCIAERIRERVNAREILMRQNTSLRISASFGVSSAQEEGNYHFEQLQASADARLYKAKQNGRNQVWSEE